MVIYEYRPDPDKYDCLEVSGRQGTRIYNRYADPKPIGKRAKPFTVEVERRPKKAGDFPALVGVPVFSLKAWEALRPLIEDSVEALPINYPAGESYFAIHVTKVVDALDRKRSELDFYPSGHVMSIDRHIFFPKKLKGVSFFKIPESNDVFHTAEFLELVTEHKLRGLKSKEVFRVDE